MAKKNFEIEGQLNFFDLLVENIPICDVPQFAECEKCWCRDCKHNSRNEGVPRNLCGTMMACPACAGCIEEDNPTICEIGNAKEGCMTRALEEGIVVKEEYLG